MRALLLQAMLLLVLLVCSGVSSSEHVYSIVDYGANGDGRTDNTRAIQKCIDVAAASLAHATILVPAGGVFLTSSLFLRSNMTLHLEQNATLLGSQDYHAYPMIYKRAAGTMGFAHASLINGGTCLKMKDAGSGAADQCAQWDTLHDVTISGMGTIDGQGAEWWSNCRPKCPDGSDEDQRPTLLGLFWIERLHITSVTLRNSPFWTTHPCFCKDVLIENILVEAPPDSRNTDGIDPDSSTNVHIRNCTIDTGDDCIAIKSGKDWSGREMALPAANIVVEDCLFRHGHGVSIGSETSGDVRNVTIRNSVLLGTDRGVRIKTQRGRGGIVENIHYENLQMHSVAMAISINMFYSKEPATNVSATPIFRNIFLSNLTATSAGQAGEFLCLPESPCSNIQLTDIHIADSKKGFACENARGTASHVSPTSCLQQAHVLL